MPYWVYVLSSEKVSRQYIGHTENLQARLLRHSEGIVFSTAPYRPWVLVQAERFSTRSEAMRRERFLKSGKGRELLARLEAGGCP